MEINNSKK